MKYLLFIGINTFCFGDSNSTDGLFNLKQIKGEARKEISTQLEIGSTKRAEFIAILWEKSISQNRMLPTLRNRLYTIYDATLENPSTCGTKTYRGMRDSDDGHQIFIIIEDNRLANCPQNYPIIGVRESYNGGKDAKEFIGNELSLY